MSSLHRQRNSAFWSIQFVDGNFGYDLVGAMVENAAGTSYESAARQLLANARITRMRIAGNTRADRRPGEAVYYLHPEITPSWASQWEPRPFDFNLPYAWRPTLYAADGGWLISAIDFTRLVAALDEQSSYPDILSTDSVAAMLAPVRPALSGDGYLGLGWDVVRPNLGTWYKGGADIGSCALAYKYLNNVIAVFTLNTYWGDGDLGRVWDLLAPTLAGVQQWPSHDLFPTTLSNDAWKLKHFSTLELADPRLSGDNADPDGDGLQNLLEFATGSDPRTRSDAPLVSAFLSPGPLADSAAATLHVAFRRLLLAHEIEYRLEGSSDLRTWLPLTAAAFPPTLNADGTVTATLWRIPESTSSHSFYRLRVLRKDQ